MVQWHSSKFQVNCAHFDTSMKFGTLIVVANTSIFRYSAKAEFRWFPWKPQLIKILENSMKFIFPSLSRHIIISVSDNNLFNSYVLFILRHLALTMHCHGDGKQQKAKTTTRVTV